MPLFSSPKPKSPSYSHDEVNEIVWALVKAAGGKIQLTENIMRESHESGSKLQLTREPGNASITYEAITVPNRSTPLDRR